MATAITTSDIGVNNNETVYNGTATGTLTEYVYARNQNYLRIKNAGSANLYVEIENDGQRTIHQGQEIEFNVVFQSFKIKGGGNFTAVSKNDIVLWDEISAVKAATTTQGEKLNALVRAGFDEYGMFKKPLDFKPVLPCVFWQNIDNTISHNFNFLQYTTGATNIFVDNDTGNDTSGTGATDAPYKTLKKACDVVVAAEAGTYVILVRNTSPFMRDQGIPNNVVLTDKVVYIVPETDGNRIINAMGQTALTWTANGTGTWKASRSVVYSVFDFRDKNSDGVYIPYTHAETLAECQATPKTWYTDNTDVWVHTTDGLVPTDLTICVNLGLYPYVKLLGSSKFYIKNIDFLTCSPDNAGFTVIGDPTGESVVGEFCAMGCTFAGGNLRYDRSLASNTFNSSNCKIVYLFGCGGAYSKSDVFNYHFPNVPVANRRDCFVLEYGTKCKDAGLISSASSNNNSTCHEGVNVLRIDCEYDNASIPVADVNGCYSICVSVTATGARHTSGNMYFGGASDTNGKAIVIDCDTGSNEKGLVSDVNGFIYNHTGNILDTGKANIII